MNTLTSISRLENRKIKNGGTQEAEKEDLSWSNCTALPKNPFQQNVQFNRLISNSKT